MIIRANQLRVGDVFLKQNYHYRVQRISEGTIKASVRSCIGTQGRGSYSLEIGCKSQEKIELISRLVIRKKPYRGGRFAKVRLAMAEFTHL